MRNLFIYLPVLLSFLGLTEGKSRSTSYAYGWRFSPSPWRFYAPLPPEYGDGSSSMSYRSSRNVPVKNEETHHTTGTTIKRESNYYQLYSNTDCEITCDGGMCVTKDYRCDGYAQCYDGADEQGCSCSNIISKDKICDGYKDCPDGGDEAGCGYGCHSTEFTCNAYNSGSKTKCISTSKQCDGHDDCPNGSDEHDCFRMVDLKLETRGIRSHGILQKRVNDEWYTVCKTSTSARYVQAYAEKACQHIIGHTNGYDTPKITAVSVGNLQLQMTKYQKESLKYIRLGETETQFAPLAACSSDSVYEVQCPTPQCGGMGNSHYHSQRRRRSLSDDDLDALEFEFGLEDFGSFDDEDENEDFEDEMGELIVGGYSTKEYQWPFLVGIFRNGEFYCGGSIVNDRWILTAAHCNHGYEKYTFEVQAGMTRRLSWSPYEQTRHVEEIYVHEGYDQKIFANDIALYKLDKPLYFSKYVTPACLPAGSEDDPKPGQMCKVAGWGDLYESGSGPDHMQEVSLPVLSKCLETFTRDPYQICAGVLEGGRDACQGDSGGPLLCTTPDGRPVVNGVVSFGRGCARENEAGAYTRISAYLDWIEKITSGEYSHSSYTARPKQCSERCHKPGGECLYPDEICSGKVECLGGEDEIGCPSYVTRNHMPGQGVSQSYSYSYYAPMYQTQQRPMQQSYYQSQGMSQSRSSSSSTNNYPSARTQTGVKFRTPDLKTDVRKTTQSCNDKEVECASLTNDNVMTECIVINAVCNGKVDCSDESDETDCIGSTENFQETSSSFSDSEEIKGYVMARHEGFQWHPLVMKLESWTPEVGQAVCDTLSPTAVTNLKRMEVIRMKDLSPRLRSGVNLMESTVVLSSSSSNVLALTGMNIQASPSPSSPSETKEGSSNRLRKINLKSENANDFNTNDMVLASVACQPVKNLLIENQIDEMEILMDALVISRGPMNKFQGSNVAEAVARSKNQHNIPGFTRQSLRLCLKEECFIQSDLQYIAKNAIIKNEPAAEKTEDEDEESFLISKGLVTHKFNRSNQPTSYKQQVRREAKKKPLIETAKPEKPAEDTPTKSIFEREFQLTDVDLKHLDDRINENPKALIRQTQEEYKRNREAFVEIQRKRQENKKAQRRSFFG